MIDFNALMNRTPEQAKAEREAADAEFAARTNSLIKDRTSKIERALMFRDRMGEWEKTFIDSMEVRATQYDMFAVFGGRLADLSSAQLGSLEKIVAKYCPLPGVDGPDLDAKMDDEVERKSSPFAHLTQRNRG